MIARKQYIDSRKKSIKNPIYQTTWSRIKYTGSVMIQALPAIPLIATLAYRSIISDSVGIKTDKKPNIPKP